MPNITSEPPVKILSKEDNLLRNLEARNNEVHFWKAQVLVYLQEISKANKGLRRLSKQNKRLKEQIHNIK